MPNFQRRHYVEIARVLAAAADDRKDLISRSDLADIVERFARALAQDNPRFDADTFSAAVWRDGQPKTRRQRNRKD